MKTMLHRLFVVFVVLPVGQAAAQERIHIEAALSTWDGQDIPLELYGFRSVPEAENALGCILNEAGLNPSNLRIAAANVPNAAAATLPSGCSNATVPCERALLYNPGFMHEMHDRTGNEWSSISVLAHEVGHHLEAHTIRPGGSNPSDELEADEYSGFVLRKLGASLADAQAVFRTFSSGGSATHPPADARLTAVANGWTRAHRTGDCDTSCLGIGAVPGRGTTTDVGNARAQSSCAGQPEGAKCWKEFASHPGCHVLDDYFDEDQTETWTGGCSSGLASGAGMLTWSDCGSEFKESGLVQDGKRIGRWVARFADGAVQEGSYSDGEQNGHWTIRTADGIVMEGAYVDGKRHGHWVFHDREGYREEGPYVDGKLHGRWIWRDPSGRTRTTTYVNGKRQ